MGSVNGAATCEQCGRENAPGQRFCGSCGAPLGSTCPACGTANPSDFRFCGGCGADLTPLPPASHADERRWTTIMFADLSGYTSLSERSDPEDVRAMVDRCMHLLGQVVDRFGGSVNQIMGDGML